MRVLQVRFRQCMHFCHRLLPVSLAGQMLHSFRWYNKCLCCSFYIFRARCCGNQPAVLLLRSSLLSAGWFSVQHIQVLHRLLQLLRFQVLISYFYLNIEKLLSDFWDTSHLVFLRYRFLIHFKINSHKIIKPVTRQIICGTNTIWLSYHLCEKIPFTKCLK